MTALLYNFAQFLKIEGKKLVKSQYRVESICVILGAAPPPIFSWLWGHHSETKANHSFIIFWQNSICTVIMPLEPALKLWPPISIFFLTWGPGPKQIPIHLLCLGIRPKILLMFANWIDIFLFFLFFRNSRKQITIHSLV